MISKKLPKSKEFFRKEIEKIFPHYLDYQEHYNKKEIYIKFGSYGEAITFAQLEQLSILLGTKNINFGSDTHDAYYGAVETDYEIFVHDVKFPTLPIPILVIPSRPIFYKDIEDVTPYGSS